MSVKAIHVSHISCSCSRRIMLLHVIYYYVHTKCIESQNLGKDIIETTKLF